MNQDLINNSSEETHQNVAETLYDTEECFIDPSIEAVNRLLERRAQEPAPVRRTRRTQAQEPVITQPAERISRDVIFRRCIVIFMESWNATKVIDFENKIRRMIQSVYFPEETSEISSSSTYLNKFNDITAEVISVAEENMSRNVMKNPGARYANTSIGYITQNSRWRMYKTPNVDMLNLIKGSAFRLCFISATGKESKYFPGDVPTYTMFKQNVDICIRYDRRNWIAECINPEVQQLCTEIQTVLS